MDCRPRSRPCNPMFKEPGGALASDRSSRAHARLGNASPSLDRSIGEQIRGKTMTIGNPYLAGWSRAACHGRDLGRLARGRGSPSGGRRGGKLPGCARSGRRAATPGACARAAAWCGSRAMMGSFRSGEVETAPLYERGSSRRRPAAAAAAYLNNRLQRMRGRPTMISRRGPEWPRTPDPCCR
jgi:hypothetical protein